MRPDYTSFHKKEAAAKAPFGPSRARRPAAPKVLKMAGKYRDLTSRSDPVGLSKKNGHGLKISIAKCTVEDYTLRPRLTPL